MKGAEHQAEPVNILLVDDRPNNLMSLKALLQQPDYNLVLAASGPEALALVLRQEFAVILLDVAMPRMDGFETASIIKEREQSKLIPILFVTASVYDMEHVFRGYDVGAVDYLRKPVDPHAVRAKVGVFVEMFRQRKKIEAQSSLLQAAEVRLRQRAEDSLQQSEALYQVTFEEAPVGIASATPDCRFTRANRHLCDLLDCAPDSLIGRELESIAEEEEQAALRARVAHFREGASIYTGEHRLSTANHDAIWAQLTISALRDENSHALRQLIVLVQDISARKSLELERGRLVRELQEGIRTRDEFLAVAAHELKTPMTPLRLQTASLVRGLGGAGDELAKEDLLRRVGIIDNAARRLDALVERLLDESQLSIGHLSLELQQVDLAEVIDETVTRMRFEAERAGSALTVEAEEGVVGQWDPLRLDQVASNLISNAIKYGARRPIEVKVTKDRGMARLSVRDHGVGIPEDAKERIFERFERVAPLRHFSGFGLGLWIVRRVVEAHGGRVSAWSEPDQGSELVVELPLRPAAETHSRHSIQLEAHP